MDDILQLVLLLSCKWHCCTQESVPQTRCSSSLCGQLWGLQGLESAQWEEALKAIAEAMGKVKGNEISFIAGKLADAESLIATKVGTAAGCDTGTDLA